MRLFLTMLPLYIFGNLHCFGMCGPLAMMIGHHRYRYFYFAGRTLSFTLTAALAGELGAVLNVWLSHYQISAITSLVFGLFILTIGLFSFFGWQYPGLQSIGRRLAVFNQTLTVLILKDQWWPTFLFGFFTVALPCGQTLVVFSACALAGDFWIGAFNGLAFALFTSPALFFAMHAFSFLKRVKPYYNKVMGICAIFVGTLGILRGLAEKGDIPHFVLNPSSETRYHIVVY